MTTNYCRECVVNWSPYQTDKGACPACGSGTVRKQEPPSPEAEALFKAAQKRKAQAAESAARHREFELWVERHDRERMQATYDEIAALPVTDHPEIRAT